MEEEIKRSLHILIEDNKKYVDLLRSRLHSINESLQSLTLPIKLMDKNSEQVNKALDNIVGQLEKLNLNFQKVTPKNILVGILSDWRVLIALFVFCSQFGVDITAFFLEFKKYL